jgi:hypothetical protein
MKFDYRKVAKAAGMACAVWVAITFMLITLPGCDKKVDPEVIKTALRMSGKYGANFGLKKWGEKEPAGAKECAVALSTNIKGTLIPYLDGGNLPSSTEVQAFINSSLFKNVNPAVKEAIVAASVALDAVLPVPKADTYLDANQVAYIKAFLTGLQQGCDQYIGTAEGKAQVQEPTWIK